MFVTWRSFDFQKIKFQLKSAMHSRYTQCITHVFKKTIAGHGTLLLVDRYGAVKSIK